MSSFRIVGGRRLKGEVEIQGAKNEALQVICATLLTKDVVTISNVPNISDVNNLIDVLRLIGCKVEKIDNKTYTFQADDIDLSQIYTDAYRKKASSLRGSIMLVGAMLGRFHKAYVPTPGGDKIGRRRLDTHFTGFVNLGVKYSYNEEGRSYSLNADRLQGTYMLLDEASITGTANIIMLLLWLRELQRFSTQLANLISYNYVICSILWELT